MKLNIVLDQETKDLLRSIDKSLRLLSDNKLAPPRTRTYNNDTKLPDEKRLSTVTDELLIKYDIMDKLKAEGYDVKEEDFD